MKWELRPARDHGLEPGERLRSQGREGGLGSLLIGTAWRSAAWTYLRAAHRLRVLGHDRLPDPPFVMIANHSSHLDALTLAAALPWRSARRAYALAAGEVFFANDAGALLAAYAVNALPVWRQRTRRADLLGFRQRLIEDGAVFILFPEGTRSRDGRMAAFKPGIGALVADTTIPVVPCYLQGAAAAWPVGRTWPRPGRLTLSIGEALTFPHETADREGGDRIAAACEAAVRALAPA